MLSLCPNFTFQHLPKHTKMYVYMLCILMRSHCRFSHIMKCDFFWSWNVKGYQHWKGILGEDGWSPDSSIYTGTCLGTVEGVCNEIYLFSFSFLQGGSIQNTKSKRCLELVENNDNEFGYQLTLQKCTGQNWTITNMLPGSTLW